RCHQPVGDGRGDRTELPRLRVVVVARADPAGRRAIPAQRRRRRPGDVRPGDVRPRQRVAAPGAVGDPVQPGHLRLAPPAATGDVLGRLVLPGGGHVLPDAGRGVVISLGDGRAVRRRPTVRGGGAVLDIGTQRWRKTRTNRLTRRGASLTTAWTASSTRRPG